MKKKIFSLLLSLAMVVAMMPMQNINVEAKTKLKTKVTVSTQAGLKKALKNKKLKSLTIKTTKKKNFSITKGAHKKVNLFVNAPNSDVKNSGSFKKINIKNIASNTWTEQAKGNRLICDTSKCHIVVPDTAEINEIQMLKANSNMTVDVSGNVNKITVEAKVTLDINGTSKNLINVNILNGANGTLINSNVKLDVKTSANTAINLYKGAEDSVVKTNNEYIIVDITNNTDSSVKIINNAGTLNTVNSGIKAVIGGNGNKISSSDKKENQEPSTGGGGSGSGGSGSGITQEDLEKAKEEASAAAASAEAKRHAAEFSAYKEEANKTVSSEAVKTIASLSDSALHVNRKDEIKLLISGIVSSTGTKIASADGLLAVDKAKTLAVEKLKAMSRMFDELAETPPSEGDIINLKDVTGDGFRIIKYYCTNDEPFANAELIAMNGKMMSWNNDKNNKTSFYKGDGSKYIYNRNFEKFTEFQKYEGSGLDTYLNKTYYNQLPDDVQAAIVPQTNLTQGLYGRYDDYQVRLDSSLISGIEYWELTLGIVGSPASYYVTNTKATASMDAKYVYALDVQDVIEYLKKRDLTYQNFRKMFFDAENRNVSRCCWLRSAYSHTDSHAWQAACTNGEFFFGGVTVSDIESRAAFTINLDRVNYSLKEASDAEQHIIIDAVDTISSADSETVINEAIQAGKQALVNQAKADEVTTYNYSQKSAIDSVYNETITTVREAGLSENATMSAEATINEIKEKAMTDIDSASKKIDVKDIKNLTINKLQSISRIIEKFKTFGNPAEKTPFMIKKIAKIKEVTTQDEVNGLVDDALEFMKIKKGDLVTLKGLSADGTEGDDQFRVIKINGNQVELFAMNGREMKYNVSSNAVSVIFDNEEKTVQKYAGSDLDNYLNSSADGNYYASLPQNIKDAIVPQNIEQYAYFCDPPMPLEKTCWIISGDSRITHIYYDENAKINVGTRNIYALDVRDIIEYLGEENLTSQNIKNMWSSPKTQGAPNYWLRSAEVYNDIFALNVDVGNILACTFNVGIPARAAFVIDLSEVKFSVD